MRLSAPPQEEYERVNAKLAIEAIRTINGQNDHVG